MTPRVPELEPKPPGPGLRALSLVLPGVRAVTDQIGPYTRWWSEQNQLAAVADGPLWVVVGDSTALGIGASAPHRGYVGVLRRALEQRDGEPWRVVNLARSGGRVNDAVDRQLPILGNLPTPDLVTACVGTNDVVWTSGVTSLRRAVRQLMRQLPAGALVARVAGASARTALVNRTIAAAGAELGHTVVDPWRVPGPSSRQRLAEDRFHPNDTGYALMARAFALALGVPEPPLPDQ